MADSRGRGRSEGGSLGPVQVRYYKKMKLQRVYPVVVRWARRDRRAPAGTPPITLRLLMGGAQVVPAEQQISANDPDATATFYVTPVAMGSLRSEKLEVLVGERKVQEVSLPARVISQSFTKKLLWLSILVPALLLIFCKYLPAQITEEELTKPLEDRRRAKGNMEQAQELLKNAADDERKLDLQKQLTKFEKEYQESEKLIRELEKDPGKVLEYRIAREMPDLPEFVTSNVPDANSYLVQFRAKIGEDYGNVCEMEKSQPINIYIFGIFLGLALISWVFHWDRRKKRSSKPIVVPRGGSEGMAMSSRRGEPVGAEADYD